MALITSECGSVALITAGRRCRRRVSSRCCRPLCRPWVRWTNYNNQPQVLQTSTGKITDNTCLIRCRGRLARGAQGAERARGLPSARCPVGRQAGARHLPQHGLPSKAMALITSECGATRSMSIKRPESPRVVRPPGLRAGGPDQVVRVGRGCPDPRRDQGPRPRRPRRR